MFAKLSTLALALPLVSAISLNALTGAITGQTVTITWSAATTDASYFTLELYNIDFNDVYAIANNVQTSLGTLTIELPQVPATDGYLLEAVATNNVGDVYDQSPSFSIGGATTTSGTAASTSSTPTTTGTGTGTGTTTSPATVSTPSVTATTAASSVKAVTTSGTSTAASSTPSTFSSGAASFKVAGIAPAAALVLSAVAGAVMVF